MKLGSLRILPTVGESSCWLPLKQSSKSFSKPLVSKHCNYIQVTLNSEGSEEEYFPMHPFLATLNLCQQWQQAMVFHGFLHVMFTLFKSNLNFARNHGKKTAVKNIWEHIIY